MGEGLGGRTSVTVCPVGPWGRAHDHLAQPSPSAHKEMEVQRRQETTQGQCSALRELGRTSSHSRWSLPSQIKNRYNFEISNIIFYFPVLLKISVFQILGLINRQRKWKREGGCAKVSSCKAHKPGKHCTPHSLLRDSHHTPQGSWERSPAAKKPVYLKTLFPSHIY